jgi:catechol 2,3-dioxygenase-like lactoylglutathione lyase family enzyme
LQGGNHAGRPYRHANLTVTDTQRSAALFQRLLGWHIRWSGQSMLGGDTVHVCDETTYLALYTDADGRADKGRHCSKGQPLNHIGLLVYDLAAAETFVTQAALKPFGHDDNDPGKRFYFFDWDGIEFEIVSYADAKTKVAA